MVNQLVPRLLLRPEWVYKSPNLCETEGGSAHKCFLFFISTVAGLDKLYSHSTSWENTRMCRNRRFIVTAAPEVSSFTCWAGWSSLDRSDTILMFVLYVPDLPHLHLEHTLAPKKNKTDDLHKINDQNFTLDTKKWVAAKDWGEERVYVEDLKASRRLFSFF